MRLINRRPDRASRLILVILPFALLLFAYFMGSATRLTENPNDKLLPSAVQMTDAVKRMAFTEDKRTGGYVLWQDTASSLQRLAIGLGISALLGLCLGIASGILPLLVPRCRPCSRCCRWCRRWRSCRSCSSSSVWAS